MYTLRRLFVLILFGILGTAGWYLYTTLTSAHVTVIVNETRYDVRTDADTVQSLLAELDIPVDEVDRLSPDRSSPIEDDMTIRLEKAVQLVLDVDGEITRIYTHSTNPLAILDEQGITLTGLDDLLVNHQKLDASVLSSVRETPVHLQVIRAKAFTITDTVTEDAGQTTARTVGDLLYEQGYALYLADLIQPPMDTPLFDGIEVKIDRSIPVLVKADGHQIETRAVGETIGDVLNLLGLQLMGQDYSIPITDTKFNPDMTIEVIRVSERIEIEQHDVPFDEIVITNPELEPDTTSILQEGVPGIEQVQVRVRLENDLEVSRIIQTRWFIREPVPRIVEVGAAN